MTKVSFYDNIDGVETFGKLFFAEIHTFEEELHSEIERIAIMNELPINWIYPRKANYIFQKYYKNKRWSHTSQYAPPLFFISSK